MEDLDEFVAFAKESGCTDVDDLALKANAIAFDRVIGREEVFRHMDRIDFASGGTLTREELNAAVLKGLMQNPKVCAQLDAEYEKVMRELKGE